MSQLTPAERVEVLKKKKEALCRAATADVASELAVAEAEAAMETRKRNIANKVEFKNISKMIGEIAELAFLTQVFGGFDMKFEISHNILCIEVRGEHDECSDGWEYYMERNGTPCRAAIGRNLKKARKLYEKYVGDAD